MNMLRMLHVIAVFCCAAAFPPAAALAQSQRESPVVTADVIKELAPTGKLRATINLGNIVLAQGTPDAPRGITVDLARELALRLGVPASMRPARRLKRSGVGPSTSSFWRSSRCGPMKSPSPSPMS
jgi:ABC-type amino acid transport substrate-binding protein